ncbi:exo-alpha-sialidase [Opitutaceae bacterium]|nr:exo-alpha-sialidase [Opitutaceae bacterium]
MQFRPSSRYFVFVSVFALAVFATGAVPADIPTNWRNIASGWTIPDEDYADQPYLVKCDDGAWLCVLTTSDGHEGATSQHIVATRSTDFGRTWSPLIDIEATGPPESSYATAVKVAGGRIYVFYNYNRDNVREVERVDGVMQTRVDTLGAFVFKFSDDHGLTWSEGRYEIPVRETEIDRQNIYGGDVRFFWHVGKPLIHDGAVYVTLHKVGNFDAHFMTSSEGNFLRSDNILSEPDPTKIRWQTLPDGDVGLRAHAGTIGEEHSIVSLSDGSLYCVYRTAGDYPTQAYSRDGGHTWTAPEPMTYGPGQRKVKHSRAANFVWGAGKGRYLYWYHNHGGYIFHNQRNPAWISAGREVDTPAGKAIAWSEPEILLYDEDAYNARISYPDYLADEGRHFITETQKSIARVHEIPAEFLDMLGQQYTRKEVTADAVVFEILDPAMISGLPLTLPVLPAFVAEEGAEGGGFTIEFWVQFNSLESGQDLLEARDAVGNGLSVTTTNRGTIQLGMRGPFGPPPIDDYYRGIADFGIAETGWDSDPGALETDQWHHVAIVVDGGPKTISFIIDGVLLDGGDVRQFGWARFPAQLRTVSFGQSLKIAWGLDGEMRGFRIHDRALRTTEVVGNWRSGN